MLFPNVPCSREPDLPKILLQSKTRNAMIDFLEWDNLRKLLLYGLNGDVMISSGQQIGNG
jgi:hypothetical protein